MTITATSPVSGPYLADGSTTTFNRTFLITSTDQLTVWQRDGDTVTEIDSGFSHTDVGETSGTIVFSTAPADGLYISLERTTPVVQQSDYDSEGIVTPAQAESDFDLATMRLQDIAESASRAVKAEVGATGPRFLASTADCVVKLDADGNLVDGPSEPDVQAAIDGAITATTQAAAASSSASSAASYASDAASSASDSETSATASAASSVAASVYAANARNAADSAANGSAVMVATRDALLLSEVEYVEGDTVVTRAEVYSYEVAADAATDHHLETAGGVKLYVQRGETGYNVKAFGAMLDGVTDDTAAIQLAINAAANDGGGRVIIPEGKARLAGDLYACYDAANNPDFPSDAIEGGRISIVGAGSMTLRDFENDTVVGSVLAFDAGYRLILSASGGSRGWHQVVSNLSVLGNNGTLIDNPFASSVYELSRIFVGNEGPVSNEATVYISENYVGVVRDLEIIGDKTLTTGRTGIGFHADPADTAGGANRYENITALYFDEGLKFGRDYDGAKTTLTYNSRANFIVNPQGGYCNVGIHFAQGITNTTVTGGWSEACDVAPYLVDNSARNIEFVSCVGSKAVGDVTHRGIIVIGNDTGTAGVDAAYNITVRNGWFFCANGTAGIHIYDAAQDVVSDNNSFHNGGAAAIALEGGVGGELILRGSNYFPETAASAIPVARRVCTITGASGSEVYTSIPQYGRRLDFTPGMIAADVDCSTWRYPPEELALNTSAATRTVTLPDLNGTYRNAKIRVMKSTAANNIILDAGASRTIKGSQTYTLSTTYSFAEIVHAGTTFWHVGYEG